MSADKSILFSHAWRLVGAKEKLVAEYRFHPVRRFRFDFRVEGHMVAIEIDGGSFAYGGGRHAQDGDKEKMNLAAEIGYRVFHFSPAMLKKDPLGCVEQVRRALL